MFLFREYFFKYLSNPKTVSEKVVWMCLICNIFFPKIDLSKIERNRTKMHLVVLKLYKLLILSKMFNKNLIRVVNI